MSKTVDLLYGLEGQERLNDCIDDLIERFIDDTCEKAGESFDTIADRIDWPVKVYEFKRMELGDHEASRISQRALEVALEYLDENWGDPESGDTLQTPLMQLLADTFGKVVVAEYKPWACVKTGKVIEYTREMAKRDFVEIP